MKKVQWLIFDMDGLLLDTERLYQRCWEEVFTTYGYESITEEERLGMVGMGLSAAVDFFTKKFGSEEVYWQLREHREEIFWKYMDNHGIPIKEGVMELLRWAKQQGIFCAIASSTHRQRALQLLNRTSILDYMDDAIFGDMVNHTKPAPDIFLQVISTHQLKLEEGIIFEDSLNGVLAANRASIDVCWIEDLVDIRHHPEVQIQYAFSSLKDVLPQLKECN